MFGESLLSGFLRAYPHINLDLVVSEVPVDIVADGYDAGIQLGEVIDIYSYQVIEELIAPVDGFLFFSRYSGVVGGGTQAFALAEEAASKWLD